jgi:5-methyltetrahydrofolate--homocysteine methyltransferase
LLETFTGLDELIAALETAGSLTDIPVVAQMVFEHDGIAPDGTESAVFYRSFLTSGAAVIGENCGDGIPAVINAIDRLDKSSVPVSAFFNAGFSEKA